MALTKRQKQVLDFIAQFVEKNGYSPSYEELANALTLASLATVHKHILALESKQYLRRSFNQSRSLELCDRYFEEQRRYGPQSASLEVPLLGRIAAGAPVEAVPGADTLNIGDFLGADFAGGATYALVVRGDSMIEDHIVNGDYVLVERADSVTNGEIVVALVDGVETTLKRYFQEPGDIVRLQPANAAMEPIRIHRAKLQIQGRVLAVLRKY